MPEDDVPELSEADSKSAEEASKAARAFVEKLADKHGFAMKKSLGAKSVREIQWKEDVGHVANLMPAIGPFADLIVVTRPERRQSRVARLFLAEALFSSTRPFTISKTVEDGEVIDLGGRHLEVLRVPGHAPDALSLLDRAHRILFTGDTFYLAPPPRASRGFRFRAIRRECGQARRAAPSLLSSSRS